MYITHQKKIIIRKNITWWQRKMFDVIEDTFDVIEDRAFSWWHS
jgi:hypothetical protein